MRTAFDERASGAGAMHFAASLWAKRSRRGRSHAARGSGGAAVTARLLPDDATGRAVAVEVLRAGGLVAMPTDTVYGVGVALSAHDGLARLFAAKDLSLIHISEPTRL